MITVRYVAWGNFERYRKQLNKSVRSIQAKGHPVRFVLNTDLNVQGLPEGVQVEPLRTGDAEVDALENGGFMGKLKVLTKGEPGEKNLYLDMDTVLMQNVLPSLEELLDYYTFSVAVSHRVNFRHHRNVGFTDLPISIPPVQGGLILFKSGLKTAREFIFRHDENKKRGCKDDQVVLREMLLKEGGLMLPPNYNFCDPIIAGAFRNHAPLGFYHYTRGKSADRGTPLHKKHRKLMLDSGAVVR